MRLCAIIPTYNNPRTIEDVVARVRQHIGDIVVVDDGSDEAARGVVERLSSAGVCEVVVRPCNGGKGAAVKTGLQWAADHTFDYALQIDADLQHDPDDIPRLIEALGNDTTAQTLVLAQPRFDASAPRGRLFARKITYVMAMVETLSRRVGDPLCGFRIYPVDATLCANARGNAMDFDPEIAVRLVWAGCRVAHVQTLVVYRGAADGGVSHYRGIADTVLIAAAHVRLCAGGLVRLMARPILLLLRWVRQ